MICGIHYFITKLKSKIDVIPRETKHLQIVMFKHSLAVNKTTVVVNCVEIKMK